jgi:hypothetical protein
MTSGTPDITQAPSSVDDAGPVIADFQKSATQLARSPAPENFKFRREDWALFRTVEGLQQRAGVPKELLRRLILKELADNGLDNDAHVEVGEAGGGYYVEDDGSGIEPDEVARLFSIARDMESTKLWRLPTRGALGNGLRVVAGGVLASGGSLTIITRNRRIELRPERDGTTTVVSSKQVDFPRGTRVEIGLGTLPADPCALQWAQIAIEMGGNSYAGKTSPWWYDAATFHELLFAGGDRPVRELIANLDGCTGGKAGDIVADAQLGRATCASVTREQAERLLRAARMHARPVQREPNWSHASTAPPLPATSTLHATSAISTPTVAGCITPSRRHRRTSTSTSSSTSSRPTCRSRLTARRPT